MACTRSPSTSSTPRSSPYLAGLIVLLGALLLAAGVVLSYLSRAAPGLDAYQSWQGRLITAVPGISILAIGALCVARQPRNRYGWLLLWCSLLSWSLTAFAESLSISGQFVFGWPLWAVVIGSFVAGLGWVMGIGLVSFIFLLFPNGEYLSARWRWVGRLLAADLAVAVGLSWAIREPGMGLVTTNPLAPPGALGLALNAVLTAAIFLAFAILLASVASLWMRFRGSAGIERQQIKWFAYGGLVTALAFISDFFVELPGLWEILKESLGFMPLPLAIGLAVLRYRLWDIDFIIRRTLVYSALTALVGLAYSGIVLVLESLLRLATGQRQSQIVIVVSTLIIAALFIPLRVRVQTALDQRFYRRKYDAAKTLAAFGAGLRNETDLDALRTHLIHVVDEVMQPAAVSLWLKGAGR